MTVRGDLNDPSVAPETIATWARHIGVSEVNPSEMRQRLGAGNLPAEFSATALRRSASPALTLGETTLSHGELDAAGAFAASQLRTLGSGPGEAVMLIADNGMLEVIAYLGILRTGAAVVLANPTLTAGELKRIAVDSGARIVIGKGEGLQAFAANPSASVNEVVGLEEQDRPVASVLLSDISATRKGFADIDPDSAAVLAFTSGTTGRPKCAPLSHRNLLASIRGVMWAWRWKPEDHLVHALPISHQHGLSGVHATLLGGSHATILAGFDPEDLIAEVSDSVATIMFGVPAIHQRLLDELGERARELGGLRLVTSGSAPLPEETARRFEAITGQRILERYGTTESGLDVSNPYEGERIPGRVGLPLPGVEIAIVGEHGEPLPAGQPGEILVRGPQVFQGYRDVESESLVAGWFRTGDDGVVDPESGYLSVVGRRKELIITGGMNVYPREVEDIIRTIADVSDVAVVGVASELWGEEVVAFVTPATVDGADLSGRLVTELAPFKRPKRIVPVDVLPRLGMGKVDRERLLELAVSSGGWTSPTSGI